MCGFEEIKIHRKIADFPVYMGTTDMPEAQDKYANQMWGKCQKCGCLQLMQLLPLEILYSEDHSSGAVGSIWERHHWEFAKFISTSDISSILEIGAAHGILAKNILQLNPTTDYTIIEPSPTEIPSGAKVVKDYVENRYDLVEKATMIVHSHLIEHLYNPAHFLRNISRHVTIGTRMCISFPDIEKLINAKGTNSLNFEHTYYLHPSQFDYLLRTNGFHIEEYINFEKHSIFIKCRKIKELESEESVPSIEYLVDGFNNMWNELELLVKKFNELIITPDEEVFLFGAHVFSQSLISLGLNIQRITSIIDNAPSKQGQRLYGTRLKVLSPNIISQKEKVTVVLNAAHYQNEIRDQLLAINPNVRIVE
jgi:hypothetical protein